MEYKKIPMVIPSEVENFYKEITKIEPETIIAGGFLCDLYLGYPYKDIDFFIHPRNAEKIISYIDKNYTKPKEMEHSDYESGHIKRVDELILKEKKIQLVFTERGIDAVNYFDIRMREFYYYNGETFASMEALEDIKKKEIKIGVVHKPVSTCFRLLKFSSKYRFSIEKESLLLIRDFFEFQHIKTESVKLYLEKKNAEKHIYDKMIFLSEQWEKRSDKKNINFPHCHFASKGNVNRIQFEKLLLKESFKKNYHYTFNESPTYKKIKECIETIQHSLHKQSIRLTFDFPDKAKSIRKNLKDPVFILTMLPKIIASDSKTYTKSIEWNLKKIESMSRIEIPTNVNVTVTNENMCFFAKNVEDYLSDKIICIDFQGIGSVIMDLEKRKVISSYYGKREALEAIQGAIKEIYKRFIKEKSA